MRDALRPDHAAPALPGGAEGELEQRSAPRFTLLIRTAKLICSEGEFLCIVRDASEAGVSVRLFHQLPPDIPLTLELPNGDRHALARVWQDESKAGFRFEEPTDIERIIEGPSPFAKRPIRVKLEVPCWVLAGMRYAPSTLCNLSQHGAQVRTDERLSLVQRVKLVADGLPEVAAKVRWRRDNCYGLSFEDIFQFGELAAIVFELQRDARAKTAAALGSGS